MKPPNLQRYVLADDFDELSKDLSMRRSAWTFISSISQLQSDTSFREFCADISLSENDANSVISELLENRLIIENDVVIVNFPLSVKPISDLLKGTRSSLAAGMFGDDNQADDATTIFDSSSAIKMRLGSFQDAQSSPSAVRSWIWESSKQPEFSASGTAVNGNLPQRDSKALSLNPSKNKETSRPTFQTKSSTYTKKSDTKKYKLQPIISQIEKLSSGGVEGSVLVYQVFLKVPTDLLRDEGIESLKLVDANTEFSSQKLCQAIVRATAQITGYNLKIIGYNR